MSIHEDKKLKEMVENLANYCRDKNYYFIFSALDEGSDDTVESMNCNAKYLLLNVAALFSTFDEKTGNTLSQDFLRMLMSEPQKSGAKIVH